jgi:hypothetical protein
MPRTNNDKRSKRETRRKKNKSNEFKFYEWILILGILQRPARNKTR